MCVYMPESESILESIPRNAMVAFTQNKVVYAAIHPQKLT